MHVILGLLGSIVTILYLLNRLANLGIDFGWLNPFHWRRRRAWSKKYEGDPIYSVDDPVQVAALVIVGAAKLEGDPSAEQKKVAIDNFQDRFSLDTRSASDLYGSAAHLLGAPQVIESQLKGLADKNAGCFSNEQAESMIEMMIAVASMDGDLSAHQRLFADDMRAHFVQQDDARKSWS